MGLYDERTGGLVTFWKSISAITALVGSGDSARIWPDAGAQGALPPFIVYTRGPGGDVHRYLSGYSGVRLAVVHVYCWATTRAGADALAELIKVRTQNARDTWSGTYIHRVFVDGPMDDGYDLPHDKSDTKQFWSRIILRIVHAEGT